MGKSRAINISFCDYQNLNIAIWKRYFGETEGIKGLKKLGMKIIAKRNQETRCLDENITTLSWEMYTLIGQVSMR